MKYLVASDIHGDAASLKLLLERFEEEKADAFLLLGDLLYHGPRNELPGGYDTFSATAMLNEHADHIIAVTGNCDADVDQMVLKFPITSPYMIFPLGENEEGGLARLVVTHGHWPKDTFQFRPGDVYLHGHTHVPVAEKAFGITELNPGSVGLPKLGNPKSYAVWEDRHFAIKTLESGTVMKEIDF